MIRKLISLFNTNKTTIQIDINQQKYLIFLYVNLTGKK